MIDDKKNLVNCILEEYICQFLRMWKNTRDVKGEKLGHDNV